MFGLDTLDVGIGVVLLFLFVSLICTAAREALEAVMKTRALDLERGLRELLSDPDGSTVTKDLFDHPMIFGLYGGVYDPSVLKESLSLTGIGQRFHMPWLERRNLPSYIPSGHFASALLDIVARGAVTPSPYASTSAAPGQQQAPAGQVLSLASLRQAAEGFPNERVKRAVLTAVDHAEGDLTKAKANVEAWFNGTMDRVSGWYKRRTQTVLFFLGLFIAVGMNIDAITVTERLATDQGLRNAAVAEAKAIIAKGSPPAGGDADKTLGQIKSVGYPIGWSPTPQAPVCGGKDCLDYKHINVQVALLTPVGWLVTALAVMLGAPFWFDVLNKFMVIRSTVKPEEKSQPEGSEDKPKPPPPGLVLASAVGPAPAPAPAAQAPPQPAPPAEPPPLPPFEPNQWRADAPNPNQEADL